MNEMEIAALQGALTRIKEMMLEDPSQPIKNVSRILEGIDHIRIAVEIPIKEVNKMLENTPPYQPELQKLWAFRIGARKRTRLFGPNGWVFLSVRNIRA